MKYTITIKECGVLGGERSNSEYQDDIDINMTSEGVVWRPVDLIQWKESSFWFKVKGKEHSVTKTKQLASVDTEKMNSIKEFINDTVTENRLKQGVGVLMLAKGLPRLEKSHIGDLIRWAFDDIVKEESDTIKASGLAEKEIGSDVAKKTRDWFFKEIA